MVDLEERTIESLPESCDNCGTALTSAEKQRILDSEAPLALCTTCAAEADALPDEAPDSSDAAY
jgi:hypothetical protein